MLKYSTSAITLAAVLVLLCVGAFLTGRVVAKGSDKSKMSYNDEELRRKLTPEQYHVVRENGTEAPFENAYWNNHKEGIYVDVVSGEPLFSSKDQFESGTGWPSFTRPIEEGNVMTRSDRSFFMTRNEVRSRDGDSHLGHVFDDGPAPTGKRYCINSASMRFIPVDKLEKEGYGRFLPTFGTGSAKMQKAIFAAGCFWGVEAAFAEVPGVIRTTVGYTGGAVKNPTYEQVCSDKTGHAEAVEVEFNPAQVSYRRLLDVFWKIHNPTTLNRQGPDMGSQYRSAIFTFGPQQQKEAMASRDQLAQSGKRSKKIVTKIASARKFYPAEEYHQKYYQKHGGKACHIH